jgi:uncharacterized membrane protein YoaK (UPF0700 family)
MKPGVPVLLSFNGGYVDTAGFLALQGLFTAHVTGNFVTLGASLVLGTSGAIGKLLALPVFCVIVALSRLAGYGLAAHGEAALRPLMLAKFLLLVAGAALAIALGPFPNADAGPALATGMVLVAAMAIQNAIHRTHLASAPPTTLMTGTTTQMMIDVVDILAKPPGIDLQATRQRLRRMGASVAAFAAGCALAALFYAFGACWAFLLPPVVALATLLHPDIGRPAATAPPQRPSGTAVPAHD